MPKINFSSSYNLAELNGYNGFYLDNEEGISSISIAGDINGDGLSDLVALRSNAESNEEIMRIIFGDYEIGRSGEISLSSTNENIEFKILADNSGVYTLANLPIDLNGDGFDDLIIGFNSVQEHLEADLSNVAYIIFGSTIINRGIIHLNNLSGENGFKILGEHNDYKDLSINNAGDINNDGIDDLVIGVPWAQGGSGVSYVIFGSSTLQQISHIKLSDLNRTNGLKIYGGLEGDYSGYSVGTIGDINNDGVDDLAIVTCGLEYSRDIIYIVFGHSSIADIDQIFLSSDLDQFTALKISKGYSSTYEQEDPTGGNEYVRKYDCYQVLYAGDINGDQIDDLVVSSPFFETDGIINYVIFGSSQINYNGGEISLSELSFPSGFKIIGEYTQDLTNFMVNNAGDFNDDKINDLIILESFDDVYWDRSYVVFGSNILGNAGVINLSNLDGNIGFKIIGEDEDGWINSVSSGGDVNGDGVYDLAITSRLIESRSYVLFGSNISDSLNIIVNNYFSLQRGQSIMFGYDQLSALLGGRRKDLLFLIEVIEHGYFSSLSSSQKVFSFSQQQLISGDINFTHDGSCFSPSYNFSVQVVGIASKLDHFKSNINFYLREPLLLRNNLMIAQGQTIRIDKGILYAASEVREELSSTLRISVNEVHHGKFSLIANPSLAISEFTQEQIDQGLIQFSHDGSSFEPSYYVTVHDSCSLTTATSQVVVKFSENQQGASSGTINKVINGSVIIGSIGFGLFMLKIYFNLRFAQYLDNISEEDIQREEFIKNVIQPSAKEIFRQISITGCCGYISSEQVKNYILEIEALLIELNKKGVNINLRELNEINKADLLNIIVDEIKKFFSLKSGYFSLMSFTSLFMPQILPEQLRNNRVRLAENIKQTLNRIAMDEEGTDIELQEFKHDEERSNLLSLSTRI